MSNTTVRRALEPRLYAWAAAQVPPLLIAWQNVDFTPPPNAAWLQATLMPANTVSGSLAGTEYKGVFQVNVFSPGQTGSGAAEAFAEAIAALFPAGLNVNGVRVTIPPSVGQGANDDSSSYMVPVRIRYQLN